MNSITEQTELDQRKVGLYHKFNVERTDGSSALGGKHYGDDYFVLNLTTDKHALPALKAYAKSCADDFPALASDLRAMLRARLPSEFVTVPETTLPGGLVVPAFMASRYLCTVVDGVATVSATETPTVEINYHDTNTACEAAGFKLIRETQALALAWNIYNVDANWSGGKVGEGTLAQGLHADTVDGPQCNDFEPEMEGNQDECRAFLLSNGEIIYDAAGHLFTWVFDDVQGDERGIVKIDITADSISLTTCPHASMEKGTGWRPNDPASWSGRALVRGGYWGSGDISGVFALGGGWPDGGRGGVSFRCTK
jgi:hypothetical protein